MRSQTRILHGRQRRIIHGDFDGGTFYVMVADITNFHTVNHFYGAESR
ncbi:MAG: hypothetical protein ACLRZZ_08760 [Enterocloster sp.]